MNAVATNLGFEFFEEILQKGGELLVKGLTRQQFLDFAQRYPELAMERDKNGNINIMAPVKGGSGIREALLGRRIGNFCEQYMDGRTFSPSTGFSLPDGAIKSPDFAWVSGEKLENLPPETLEISFLPLAPDFVAEIRSQSDQIARLKKKMKDVWIANGVRLGWLIDPFEEKAYVYRADGSMEAISGFHNKLSGEDVLPGFQLDLSEFRVSGK
jgi:Uma2 family endonuclease